MNAYKCDCGREREMILGHFEPVECDCGQRMCRIVSLPTRQSIPIRQMDADRKTVKLKLAKL